MKSSFLYIFCLLIWLGAKAQGELTVTVQNIVDLQGAIGLCLYDSPRSYMHDNLALRCVWVTVSSTQVSYKFEDISAGEYAVVIFQDLNGNQDLDTNFVGIPKEPYGFSNNPSTTFGPPSFEDASVRVDGGTTISIVLK